MKKILIIPFIFVFYLIFCSTALAISDPFSHQVISCYKIVNLNKFPDIVLISKRTVWEEEKTRLIENNELFCDDSAIYWGTEELQNSTNSIDLNNLLIKKDTLYIDNSNHLVNEEKEYVLKKSKDNKLFLYKSKETLEYNDGSPKKIEKFDDSGKSISIEYGSEKITFWQSILSFLKNIFFKNK